MIQGELTTRLLAGNRRAITVLGIARQPRPGALQASPDDYGLPKAIS